MGRQSESRNTWGKELHIENETEKVDYPWKKVHHVYRGKTATYLYATPARAFILPHYFIEDGADALWTLLRKKLPAEKLTALGCEGDSNEQW